MTTSITDLARRDAFIDAAKMAEDMANNIGERPDWVTAEAVNIAKTAASVVLRDLAAQLRLKAGQCLNQLGTGRVKR